MTFRRTLHVGLAVLLLLVLAGAAGFGRAATPAPPRQLPLRVLFIGNSQTSTNDLPAFVAEIAKESKHGKVTYQTIAPSAVTLGGLWNGRGNPAYIDGRWDAVVLQQGPSVTPDRRAELCFYATEWADSAREQGRCRICSWSGLAAAASLRGGRRVRGRCPVSGATLLR